MSSLIITHPGSAHFDEFFAVSLILANFPEETFYVERREPSIGELDDPDIWVVDIGERLEPHLKNFDHHQAIDLNASFVLVSDYLGLTNTLATLPWFDFKDKIDRFGPARTGAEIGTNRLRITYSPFEEWYLDMFSSKPSESLALMRSFGISMIKKAKGMSAKFKFWEKCKQIVINNHRIIIGHTDDTYGAEEYNEALATPAAVLVTYDSRGKGWKLCRFDHAPFVDFSKLTGRDDIKFAHKTGFVAKTHERLNLDDVIELVRLALPDC